MEELLELLDKFGEWGWGEGKEEGKKGDPTDQLPFPVEGRLVVQRHWVAKAEEDDEDKEQKPSGVVKDSDKGHHSNGDEKYGAALRSEKGIGDVASV